MSNTTTEEEFPCNETLSNGAAGATVQSTTPHPQPPLEVGSSIYGAIFNFTNCIVGAGAIGLGGAFADSGGLISVATIIFFAILTKLSLDLVVAMSVENSQSTPENGQRSASYEELGEIAFGSTGRWLVLFSKFLYSFGCMVAYIIVVKDNFAPALQHFVYGGGASDAWFNRFLLQDGSEDAATWFLGIFVVLPLCLLRDMSPLSNLGAVSIASMGCIVLIVMYIYVEDPHIRREGGSTYENWWQIRPGFVESWGTFVFTFVSQHTVNITFESLHPEIRSVKTWKTVSSWSISVATIISLLVGLTVYMTFLQDTRSDLFDMYPPMRLVDLAKILLCVTMLLTFPLPFFSCRELLIFSCIPLFIDTPTAASADSMEEPLLVSSEDRNGAENAQGTTDSTSVIFNNSREVGGLCKTVIACCGFSSNAEFPLLVPGEEKQLSLPFHVALSILFWGVSTFLAIISPNLGDVLDLVGSATGTAMAFILPGLLSLKLQGYTHLALFILVVGGAIGFMGTLTSLKKLVGDV